MDYTASLAHLQALFSLHDFKGHQGGNRKHAVTLEVDKCRNGTAISISFPGYKATPAKPDYRVDITKDGVTNALSHANIIVDIVNKCTAGGMDRAQLGEALKSQASNCDLDYMALVESLPYTPVAPSSELLAEVRAAHTGKPYNALGNRCDLALEELFKSIKWIVIQEDINYPISKGFLGRKMPYGRYLEAIYILENNTHSLTEVIQRAISHSRPPKWAGMDYSFENTVR